MKILIVDSIIYSILHFYFLKINDSNCLSNFYDDCAKIILPNRHRIISLCLKTLIENDFLFKSITLDQSFHRLESLNISIKQEETLLTILQALPLLSRLISFRIRTCSIRFSKELLSKMFEVIFNLSTLKYLHIFGRRIFRWPLLSINTNDQCNHDRTYDY